MGSMLEFMLSYLANVSDEQFQEDWAKVSELEDEGPTLEEYLAKLPQGNMLSLLEELP